MNTTAKLLLPLALTLAISACSNPADEADRAAEAAPATTAQAPVAGEQAPADAIPVASGT